MFSLTVTTTSCEKDPITPDPKTIDLSGNWDFQSLEFGSSITYDCNQQLNRSFDLITLDLNNVTNTSMTLFTDCMDIPGETLQQTYPYNILDGNIIDYGDNKIKFEIVNFDTFDGTVLKLKLIDQGVMGTLPLTGIYTLNKQ